MVGHIPEPLYMTGRTLVSKVQQERLPPTLRKIG